MLDGRIIRPGRYLVLVGWYEVPGVSYQIIDGYFALHTGAAVLITYRRLRHTVVII